MDGNVLGYSSASLFKLVPLPHVEGEVGCDVVSAL